MTRVKPVKTKHQIWTISHFTTRSTTTGRWTIMTMRVITHGKRASPSGRRYAGTVPGNLKYGLGSSDQRTESVELTTTVKSPQRSLDMVLGLLSNFCQRNHLLI